MYKVGDKVRVRKDLVEGQRYGSIEMRDGMREMTGKETTVRRINYEGNFGLKDSFLYSKEMLEPVEKTLDNLEVGDIIEANEGESMVLGICGCIVHVSYTHEFDIHGGTYTIKELKGRGYRIKKKEPKKKLKYYLKKYGEDRVLEILGKLK